MRFSNQRVIISGGTRGLGRAASLAFLSEGAQVQATYRGNEEAAEELRSLAGDNVERLTLTRCDVSQEAEVQALWDEIGDQPISVLVNNAGIRRDALMPLMDYADWQAVLDTNLTGGYLMSRGAVKNMMAQRYGRILFVTSPTSRIGFQGQTNYGASKAGQIGLTRSLCKEVASRGITVNCVSPGFIATELLDDLPPELIKEYKKSVPARRFGRPEEVAAALLFLASADAAYINGTTLEVAGGI
jgi:3-oxoacyl-[acyl-carrier protein] reductase